MLHNTYFQKQERKLATYRNIGIQKQDPIARPTHDQLDYVITQRRWRNAIVDVEGDPECNVDSDHNPLIAKVRIKLKALKKKHGGEVVKFEMCRRRPKSLQ